MSNSTQLYIRNETLTINDVTVIIRFVLYTPIVFLIGIFLYFMGVILKVFFNTPQLRENSRYVLFIHMLVNDSLYIAVAIFLHIGSLFSLYWPLPLCFLIISICTGSFKVTPYNLAVMSLERYAAICHPLRHAELCNVQRSRVAIAAMWLVGLLPQVVSFIIFCFTAEKEDLSRNVICDWPSLTINEAQSKLRTTVDVGSFLLVAGIIIWTYMKVVMVAQKVCVGVSASKAEKTVLLHALQLVLCMLAFTHGFTEKYLRQYFIFLPMTNFLVFMCLPRLISPLIYGIRDEVFRMHMSKLCQMAPSLSS